MRKKGEGKGGRKRETDEGRAAGGCHGNRQNCYTAHVNSVDGAGGAAVGDGGWMLGKCQ